MTVLDTIKAWIHRTHHDDTCHICGETLPDGDTTAVCLNTECQYQDWASKPW